ncbi:MAG: hypothetical protein ACRDYA_19665 [Egibacteraceae bacterium]
MAVASVLTLVSVVSTGCASTSTESPPPTFESSPSFESSPTPAALSPAAYQAELAAAEGAVAPVLDQVAKAPALDTLTAELGRAQVAATDAANRLDGVLPPDQIRVVHADLTAGLRQLAADLSQLAGEVASLQLCAAPAVTASLSTKDSMNRLRSAAAALGQGSYQWGQFLPPPTAPPDRHLPNGHIVVDNRAPGSNQLEVDNGTGQDAVITLSQAGRPIVSVYVASTKTATLRRISDGAYDLYYTVGTDWDEPLRTFTRTCGFSRFDQLATFTSTRSEYTILSIGLQPTIGGTATTTKVDPQAFPKA